MPIPGVFGSMLAAGAVVPGTQTITSSATFTVPEYNTLLVTLEGGTGSVGASGTPYDDGESVVAGGAGGAGGLGGKCIKSYPRSSGPTPGNGIAVTIASFGGDGNLFVFGSSPRANNGDSGGTGGNGAPVDPDAGTGGPGAPGSAGANGTALNGDTNTTGGSGTSTARVIIAWS